MLTNALLMLLLLIGAVALHKVRRVHLMLFAMRDQAQRDSDNLYHQLALLLGLYRELDLDKSLPGTRGWAASPDFLMVLARHALDHKPATVVECSSGTSTVVLARCMQLNGGGMVYSLEHDPVYARQTNEQLARHGLSDFAQVLVAPITAATVGADKWQWYDRSVLPQISIDMLVIDGPPESTGPLARYPAGPLLFPQLGASAAVFLDDAARPDETAIAAKWQAAFPHLDQTRLFCEKGCLKLQREAAAVA
jgi:predicted O-methyltransferase YrrM